MEKKFEITFSYWKQKEIGYFDVLPNLEDCGTYTIQTKIVKASTTKEAEERLQSVYTEPLRIIQTKEIKQEKELVYGR